MTYTKRGVKSSINTKHPLWYFKKYKGGMVGIMKRDVWEALIDRQIKPNQQKGKK